MNSAKRLVILSSRNSILDGAVFACRAYRSNGVLTDLSPYRRAIQHGSAAGGDSNDPLWLPYAGVQHLYLPGIAGNYASTPDSAALSITGDIDLRVQVALDDWTPGAINMLLAKWLTTGNQRSWQLSVTTSGLLGLIISEDGASGAGNASSSVATGLSDGSIKWVRCTYRISDQRVQFFLSDDGVSWDQLGTDRTLSGTPASIFDSTALVEVGSSVSGVGSPATGKFYRAQIYNGIGGTLAFDADFTDQALLVSPFTSFVEKSANAVTVTINRAATGRKAVVVERDKYLHGTDDVFVIADADDLDFALTDSFTVCWLGRLYGGTANQCLIAKKNDIPSANPGYSIDRGGSGTAIRGAISDGTNQVLPTGGAITVGVISLVSLRRDAVADTVQVLGGTDGVTGGTALADTLTATLANTRTLTIGGYSGLATFGDFEFLGAALFRRALSTAELTRVKNALLGLPGY